MPLLAEPFRDLLADDLMDELAPVEPEKTITPTVGILWLLFD